jgi:hypothetical protein
MRILMHGKHVGLDGLVKTIGQQRQRRAIFEKSPKLEEPCLDVALGHQMPQPFRSSPESRTQRGMRLCSSIGEGCRMSCKNSSRFGSAGCARCHRGSRALLFTRWKSDLYTFRTSIAMRLRIVDKFFIDSHGSATVPMSQNGDSNLSIVSCARTLRYAFQSFPDLHFQTSD